MNSNNNYEWLSYFIGFGLKPDYEKMDNFLLGIYPQLQIWQNDNLLTKFIYTRYFQKITSKFEVFKNYLGKPYCYTILRLYTDKSKTTTITNKMKNYLNSLKETKIVDAWEINNDWGLHNENCYKDFGSRDFYIVIDDYMHYISMITLELLTYEQSTKNKDSSGRKIWSLYKNAPYWAHMLLNQMGIDDSGLNPNGIPVKYSIFRI